MPIGSPFSNPAVSALNMGQGLQQQQQDQSEELRKKKLKEQQLMGMSPSVASLFGPLGGGLGG